MNTRHLISTQGSDRGTGYNMSGKLIRRDGKLFIGWLDAPPEEGTQARIMIGVCDEVTGEMHRAFQIGEGIDNHCGPALILDDNGRLHALVGAHHGPFFYRWSDNPEDPNTWSETEALGALSTYPSFAVDQEGTLHLSYRESGDRWAMWYRRKKANQNWEPPRSIAVSPVAGYNHFMQSLTTGPDGTLHLIFQFHFAESGHAADCRGRAAVHVYSEDGGDTWYNEGVRFEDPLTMETMRRCKRSTVVLLLISRVSKWRIVASQRREMGACGSISSPQWLEHGRWTRDIAIPRSQRQIALYICDTSAQKAV